MSQPEPFVSILCPAGTAAQSLADAEPDCFGDLHLDHVVTAICSSRGPQRLEPWFWSPLGSAEAVTYRQEVLKELERDDIRRMAARYVEGLRLVSQQLDLRRQVRYPLQEKRCLFDAARAYRAAVARLARDLSTASLHSAGFLGLAEHLRSYTASAAFTDLGAQVDEVDRRLGSISYLLHVRGNRIHVRRPHEEPDFGRTIEDLFSRFHDQRAGEPAEYRRSGGFSHVDAAILDEVAALYPEEFDALDAFAEQHRQFVSPAMARLGPELDVALACVEFKERVQAAGLPMCYPTLTDGRVTEVHGCYDLALALARMAPPPASRESRRPEIVTNSFAMEDPEQFLVVTGPNQGGKTTFARCFGQLHHLAALGCAVPAESARLGVADLILTLFEREEDTGSDRGKLQDDLVRMRDILDRATPDSVVVLNEIFSSTSTEDSRALASRVLERLLARGCRGVCVTFLDELSRLGPGVVSLVADTDPGDPGHRLYTLTRRPADSRAHTRSLVARYRLRSEDVTERVLS